MDLLALTLVYYAKMWSESLKMEKTIGRIMRLSFGFPDVGRFGEALSAALTNYKGSGGKGSGADLTNGIKQKEVKTVCLCQPSVCSKCQRCSPWSDVVCSHCGHCKLIRRTDSRFGISSTSHIKNKDTLEEYMCVLIEHTKNDDFRITVWKIESANEYFSDYIETQSKQSSKTCNLLPRSFDFLMSAPVRLFQVTLTLHSEGSDMPTIGSIDLEHYQEKIKWSVLNGAERKLLGIKKDEEVSIDKACKFLKARKKTHGKPRGETARHL